MKKTAKPGKNALWAAAIILILIAAVFVFWRLRPGSAWQVPEPDTWPTQGWLTSTPEEQGFDSAKLAEGLQAIQQNNIPIHSIMVVRNGRAFLEAHFYPYDGQLPHNTGSVTKSLMTTLIGIAADQGKLSLDDKMVSFFANQSIANPDPRKNSITVRDLASMSAGFDCSGLPDELTVKAMEASPNYVQFSLDLPMAYQPGTHWEYCGVNMHLLSAILQKATGMSSLEFARQYLFEPLGIHEVAWPADEQGINLGAGNARMVPGDMAKFGFLWLHQGLWDGRQVVSRSWVNDSVKHHYETPGGDAYGYGWWASTGDTGAEFFALGVGGQRILVIPSLNIVLVTQGGGFETDEVIPYLAAALVDTQKSIAANPSGVEKLATVLGALPKPPAPQAAAPLPELAQAISGKTIRLDENPMNLETLQLEFNNTNEAGVQFTFTDGSASPSATIGLDGVYRFNQGMNLDRAFHPYYDFQELTVGLRGEWIDAQTFILEYDTIINRYFYLLQMHFEADGMTIEASERGSGAKATFEGKWSNP